MKKVLRALLTSSALLFVACGSGEHHSVNGGSGEAGAPDAAGGRSGDAGIGEAGAPSQATCNGTSTAPVWPKNPVLATVGAAGAVTLSWPSATGADRYKVFADDVEIATVSALSFTAPAAPGTPHKFRVDAAELCGQVATGPEASASSAPPPDPKDIATPLPTTVLTGFPKSIAFIYSGQNPVQFGVKPGAIDDTRVSVVRGTVKQCDGTPVAGVKVSVPNEPGLGWTFSRADGGYDLAVNGGCCEVGVQYDAAGSPPVQRKVTTPPNQYVSAPDVVVVPYDSKVTVIAPTATSASSAQGSLVTDSAGARHATVIFPPGVTASMTLADGTTVPLPTLHVRATEYTSDQCGANAMPGNLPAESAYTYAAELSVDEAVQAGAKSVDFSKPVSLYVENFLGFTTGTPVPTGYYNRDTQCWQPVPNGVIVTITAISGGNAAVDVNGDGKADDAATLTKLGITPEETAELSKLYKVGTSLWRTPLPHFSPWDTNWPQHPVGNEGPPNLNPVHANINVDPDNCEIGSDIGCVSGTLRETVPLAGAANALVYSTKRVPRPQPLRIQVTPADIPDLKAVSLLLDVAGQHFSKDFDVLPNQSFDYAWDGKDAYGRTFVGDAPVHVTLTYGYVAAYDAGGDAFGENSSGGFTWKYVAARRLVYVTTEWIGTISGQWAATLPVGTGWELADNVSFDPTSGVEYSGNGSSRKIDTRPRIQTIAGTGTSGNGGDEGPAIEAQFKYPVSLAIAADNTIYVADEDDNRVRKITPDGIIHAVAGTGNQGQGPLEGDALKTDLSLVNNLALDCQGNVYFTDGNGLIRKVTPDGKIHSLPLRDSAYNEGLDGPVASASFDFDEGAAGIVATPDCRVYLTSARGMLLRLNPDDNVHLVAGNPAYTAAPPFFAENTPARGSWYGGISNIAFEPGSGSFLLAGQMISGQSSSIIRITPDGLQHLVAGVPTQGFYGATGDGVPALTAGLTLPTGIAPSRLNDGAFAFIDQGHTNEQPPLPRDATWIRTVDRNGIIRTLAGDGTKTGEEIPAIGAYIPGAQSLVVGSDNSIYVAASGEQKIRRISALNGFGAKLDISPAHRAPAADQKLGADTIAAGETAIPDATGSVVDVFDKVSGQHLRSFDALTGVLQRAYTYDDSGKVTSIADTFGNTTTYAYDDAGKLSTVTSPYGLVTTMHYDADGNLDKVTNPAGESYAMTYDTGTQLLASFQNPSGNLSSFAYDDLGRLSKDSDAAGGSKTVTLSGSDAVPVTTVTTALGRSNQYSATLKDDGTVTARTVQRSYGASSSSAVGSDGRRTVTYEGGSTLVTTNDDDPRFGGLTPMAGSVTVSSGAQSSVTNTIRQYTLSDPQNPFSLTAFTETNTVNGNAYSRTFDRLGKTITSKSPAGRTSVSKLNDLGETVEIDHPGVAPITVAYDDHGRPTSYTQGQRTSTITYDVHGYVSQNTDALGQVRKYGYDAVGRPLSAQLGATSNSPTISSTYDPDNNLTSVVPPAGAAHALNYTPVDLVQSYVPPKLAGDTVAKPTSYAYSVDHELTDVTRADGGKIHFDYDAKTARTSKVTLPGGDGNIAFTYDDAKTKDLLGTSGPAGTSFQLGYTDGLVTSLGWSGTVNGVIRKTFDGKFRLATESVDGFNGTNRYVYDTDGLLTGIDFMSITREPTTGRVSGSSFNAVSDVRSYDATYGEPSEYKALASGSTLFDVTYGRDLLGRITDKTETINGTTTKYAYTYDDQGRLETVTAGGTVTASYSYDANGNRTERQAGAITELGTYDAQDRLTSYGNAHYTYTDAGELLTKTVGSAVTGYHYDALGSLRSVTLPSGDTIGYEVDAASRRIGKFVNGALVSGYLYRSNSQLKAVLDATGNITASFTYGPSPVPVVMTTPTNTYRIITDHLGSVRLVVDVNSGVVAQRLSYDEFGRVAEDTNPGFQPFGFAGGLYDPQTALVHFGARDYDPQTGRWTTKDPIQLSGGFNLYLYVGNDPINLTDISGLLAGVPDWLLWLDDHGVLSAAGDFSAGVSSALTFGLSDKLIAATGLGKYGSKCSGAYFVGNLAGQALFLVGGSLATVAESAVAEGAEAASAESEVYYRTMSPEHAQELLSTGRLPATSETFISPTQAFSEAYDGVLVELQVEAGTTDQLAEIGVRDFSAQTAEAYPDMDTVSKGWTQENAFFKSEGGQINIGLGRGPALDIFNSNLTGFNVIR